MKEKNNALGCRVTDLPSSTMGVTLAHPALKCRLPCKSIPFVCPLVISYLKIILTILCPFSRVFVHLIWNWFFVLYAFCQALGEYFAHGQFSINSEWGIYTCDSNGCWVTKGNSEEFSHTVDWNQNWQMLKQMYQHSVSFVEPLRIQRGTWSFWKERVSHQKSVTSKQ